MFGKVPGQQPCPNTGGGSGPMERVTRSAKPFVRTRGLRTLGKNPQAAEEISAMTLRLAARDHSVLRAGADLDLVVDAVRRLPRTHRDRDLGGKQATLCSTGDA